MHRPPDARPETVGTGEPTSEAVARPSSRLTVLIPAYNESASIEDTIRSVQNQTLPPEEIIVIDDCSTDDTGERARRMDVSVLRPPKNTGSKAGAQNYALRQVSTGFTMAVDADTILAPDAIEKLLCAFDSPKIAAACGYVIPRYVRTVWERGRYIEYLFAFSFFKQVQDYYERPLISSGCFSAYRTDILRQNGGWSTRTVAEDMDLTWNFYREGHGVRFVPEAVCFPIEPHNYKFMSSQLRRWSHGFLQNVRIHWRDVLDQPYLRTMLMVCVWDAVIASAVFLLLLPLLAIFVHPVFLLWYAIDLPAIAVPVIVKGIRRREVLRVLTSLPSFFVLRFVNAVFLLRAAWKEFAVRRPLLVYEKGH